MTYKYLSFTVREQEISPQIISTESCNKQKCPQKKEKHK